MRERHFELAHVSSSGNDPVQKFDQSGFYGKSFPDPETQLETLKKVCRYAHRSEEFFLINVINARNQWLRTVVGHDNLGPDMWTKAELDSDIIIHSNILPYDPHWSKLRERMGTGIECEIGKHGSGSSEDGSCEQPRTPEWISGIQADDVKLVRRFEKGNGVSLITWRGGRFIRKEEISDTEFEVVKIFSHAHIVYGFCQLCDGKQSLYFMEFMDDDLFSVIVDRGNRTGGDKPPFLAPDSIDILLQTAKAMSHMHEETVNVVHCDLKPDNILICRIATSDNASHYVVKIADFGSARFRKPSFIAGDGTTAYSAPEALKQRKDKQPILIFAEKIDVYSFGVVAFEVLTGSDEYRIESWRHPGDFKLGVIANTKRPPLRAKCRENKELVPLIEKCWHEDPSQRPSFVEICERLDKVRKLRISEQLLQNPPRRASLFSLRDTAKKYWTH